jgi:hypothetical protein
MRLSRGLVVSSGFVLIALGIVGLIWSHALASGANATAHAWWVGTLQALGVGFVVGGLIDVLVISGLEGVIRAEEQRRKQANKLARAILHSKGGENERQEGLELLRESYELLDEDVRQALATFVYGEPRLPE